MTGKILVTTRSFRKLDGPHQQILRDAGYEIVNSPYARRATADELAELVGDVEAVIMGLDECTAPVIAHAEKLKVISRYGIGIDNVDLSAATAAGIVVTNTPGANALAVAEHTFALMLAIARSVPLQDRHVHADDFAPISGVELYESTLGLIGMGRIGREVALRAAAFGMRILYYDPFPPPDDLLTQTGAESREVRDLLAESDFVSLHAPLTDESHHLINAATMAVMKPTAYLINTARGGLVDEAALYTALRDGQIAGAAFDVFAEEPPTGNPLLTLDNFIATPHSGSATRQTTLRMGLMAAQNALMVLRGERPPHVVNPQVYERDQH
ncbi:MAG: phosphoglycerate dehydrogenase [Chloroflexi bacterium]|nr:phosphoglycerate dehydrogenase [Chloroflexota bacterium]